MPIAPLSTFTPSRLDIQPQPHDIETPVEDLYRVALVGHFRGHSEAARPLAERRASIADRTLFDSLVARIEPSLTLPVDQHVSTVRFRHFRDFHPDRLWVSSPVFDGLGPRPAPSPPDDEFADYLRRLIEPAAVPRHGVTADRITGCELTARMRSLVRHADFRRLEATWRGLELLAHRLSGAPGVRLEVIDLSRGELDADLIADCDLEDTATYKLLAKDQPYCLIVADFHFGPAIEDLAVLHRLGRIGRHAGAPVIAGALPDADTWTGACPAAWREFQQTAAANWIGLAYPRYLSRAPYGKHGNPCELLDFEEFASHPAPESLCWANSAWLCALVLAESLASHGMRHRPDFFLDVSGLPRYQSESGEHAGNHPCVEETLGEASALAASTRGLITVVPAESGADLRIVGLQSIARTRLAGRWAGD